MTDIGGFALISQCGRMEDKAKEQSVVYDLGRAFLLKPEYPKYPKSIPSYWDAWPMVDSEWDYWPMGCRSEHPVFRFSEHSCLGRIALSFLKCNVLDPRCQIVSGI